MSASVILRVHGSIEAEVVENLVREFIDREPMRRAGVVHAPALRLCVAGFEAQHPAIVKRQLGMFAQWLNEHEIQLLAEAFYEQGSKKTPIGFLLFTETNAEIARDAYARCATAALSPWSLGPRT